MPHVTPPLPDNGDTAYAEDISIPFSLLLAIFNGHIGPDNIEPGSLSWGVMNQSMTNAIPGGAMRDDANLELYRRDTFSDFIAKGCHWSHISGLNASMTEGVAYIDAKRLEIDLVGTHTFAASRDTYISISNTGSIGYSEVLNNASSPGIGTNSIWCGMVRTNATTITKVQLTGTDSNSNPIHNTSTTVDTGWFELEYESDMTIHSDAPPMQARLKNGVVYLRGGVKPKSGSFSSGYVNVAKNCPVWMRHPWNSVAALPSSGSTAPGRMYCENDGNLKLQPTSGTASYYLINSSFPRTDE